MPRGGLLLHRLRLLLPFPGLAQPLRSWEHIGLAWQRLTKSQTCRIAPALLLVPEVLTADRNAHTAGSNGLVQVEDLADLRDGRVLPFLVKRFYRLHRGSNSRADRRLDSLCEQIAYETVHRLIVLHGGLNGAVLRAVSTGLMEHGMGLY